MAAKKNGGVAPVLGQEIAAGLKSANATPTWGELLQLFDVAEGTEHGRGRRAELDEVFARAREDRKKSRG